MRHLDRGGKFVFGGHKHLLTVSGFAAIASLGSIYLLVPPTNQATLNQQASVVSLTPSPIPGLQNELPPDKTTDSTLPTANAQDNMTSQVIINGQKVPLSQQGTIHKTLSGENGQTSIDISIEHHASQNSGSTSTNLNISSHSSSHTERVDHDEHSPPF